MTTLKSCPPELADAAFQKFREAVDKAHADRRKSEARHRMIERTLKALVFIVPATAAIVAYLLEATK